MMGAILVTTTATPALAAPTGGDSSHVRDVRANGAAGRTALGPLGPLTDLVVQRLFIGDQVAAAKFGTGKPIDDPVREQQELDSIRQSANALGISPDAAAGFFRQQISASKLVQQGLFDQWTAHPDQAPTTRPDLAQIREKLDALTTELLGQLVAQQRLLRNSPVCEISLTLAQVSAEVFGQLDALHHTALTTALSATCLR
jgi:chorismate mutase